MSIDFKIMKNGYCEMYMDRFEDDSHVRVHYTSYKNEFDYTQETVHLDINDIDELIHSMNNHKDLLLKHREKLLNKLNTKNTNNEIDSN